MPLLPGILCLVGCVSQTYHPGPAGHPFNRILRIEAKEAAPIAPPGGPKPSG